MMASSFMGNVDDMCVVFSKSFLQLCHRVINNDCIIPTCVPLFELNNLM